MKIAIVGSGNVGSALQKALAKGGHTIVMGARGKVADAVQGADAVILAVPFAALRDVVTGVDLKGKVVIDATNNVGAALPQGMSGAEQLAEWAVGAKVVKCFNQTGAENMADATFKQGKPVMFAAGDDAEARTLALTLAKDAGFEAFDAGPLVNARWLEGMARLWIHLAFKSGQGRSFAFGLLRK